VANLPYGLTSKFFRQFLEFGPKPTQMIVMIQKEVSRRLTAKPGEMNLLALSAQFFSEPELLFDVVSGCFWPEPEIWPKYTLIQPLRHTCPSVLSLNRSHFRSTHRLFTVPTA